MSRRWLQSPPAQGVAVDCPACRAKPMDVFLDLPHAPANSCILLSSEAEARACPTGDIRLGLCRACGFIFNTVFDQDKTEYSGRYEETQAFSGTFNAFHKRIAQQLIDKYDLHGKDVLEIGCGKGEFLVLLAELGGNRCVGIDPGVHVERLASQGNGRVRCIADFYSEKYGELKVDFLACKMTLEHIPNVEEFVSTVRRGLGEQTDTIVFFQVPEALRILRQAAFEDIYHEHCGYFTRGSLGRLFERCGFDVIAIDVEYDGQYLTIEARPRANGRAPSRGVAPDDLAEITALVETFPERLEAKLETWRAVLDRARANRDMVVIWGSGSKAVAFLKMLDPEGTVQYVTDVNPFRHDHYMPLSGQRIVAPAELVDIRPDLVIAMNRIYEDEIGRDLARMGVETKLLCL